ncbi:FRG domain-containing protein [Azospirillum sp. A39]|uniref:FRG domain-containing protein n=1 Tax=Azospirillum sp. A39 TaxID=3462279 RepID=UPI0040454C82
MQTVRIGSLMEYIEFISGQTDRTVAYRGAKHPEEDMKPSVVRSWQRNRRLRGDGARRERPAPGLWDFEARLIEGFKRQAVPFLDPVPDGHLNWLAVAQHYELPTRLLDWTRNPLIALYFAASNHHRHREAALWRDVYVFLWTVDDLPESNCLTVGLDRLPALRPVGDGRIADTDAGTGPAARPARIQLFTPPNLSSRITSQEGLFSFEEQLSERPFPDLAREAGLDLTCVHVAGASRLDILRHLNRLGVETGKLFPDLPGLCAHQRWVAEWLW